jgi:squalene-hopene/tetraprenyl-beta-curcumene cyclase
VFLVRAAQATGVLSLASFSARGDADAPGVDGLLDRGVAFLRPRQDAQGAWSADRKEPGITALVVTALLRSGRVAPGEPVISKGLTYLEQFVGSKGGLSEAPHSVYSTSVALMAFKEANAGGKYDRVIQGGQDFLKTSQVDEGEGKGRDDLAYGGLGYGGGNSRPDLSNTSFFVEALRESGLPADDPALRKALVFVSRCQNLKSEFNDQPWAGKVNDGGFVYNPGAGNERGQRKGGDGTLRSYAGMTYAGLKSMIYAGLTRDDPRVRAALAYIKDHYSVEENPGQGQRGLYYYYQTFAKAMALLDEPTLTDSRGKAHDWRAELVAALSKRQNPDGSWVNTSDSFMEGDPNIVTSYALLALAGTRKAPPNRG